MAKRGMITTEALDIYRRHGQTTRPLSAHHFRDAPTLDVWQAALGHQCRLQTGPQDAITTVGLRLDALNAIQGGYEMPG